MPAGRGRVRSQRESSCCHRPPAEPLSILLGHDPTFAGSRHPRRPPGPSEPPSRGWPPSPLWARRARARIPLAPSVHDALPELVIRSGTTTARRWLVAPVSGVHIDHSRPLTTPNAAPRRAPVTYRTVIAACRINAPTNIHRGTVEQQFDFAVAHGERSRTNRNRDQQPGPTSDSPARRLGRPSRSLPIGREATANSSGMRAIRSSAADRSQRRGRGTSRTSGPPTSLEPPPSSATTLVAVRDPLPPATPSRRTTVYSRLTVRSPLVRRRPHGTTSLPTVMACGPLIDSASLSDVRLL